MNISTMGYFAAHAPDVPDWFEYKMANVAPVDANPDAMMARLVRWRMAYARAMVAERWWE